MYRISFSFSMLLILVSFSFIIGIDNAHAQKKARIGYVDLVRAMSECKAGKKAQDQLKKEVQKFERSLKKKQEQVQKLQQEIEKKAQVLGAEQQQILARDLRESMRDLERSAKDAEDELKIRDRTLTGKILVQMQQIVAEIGKEGGYTVILEGNNAVVLYGKKNIDLTDKVITTHDGRFPGGRRKRG